MGVVGFVEAGGGLEEGWWRRGRGGRRSGWTTIKKGVVGFVETGGVARLWVSLGRVVVEERLGEDEEGREGSKGVEKGGRRRVVLKREKTKRNSNKAYCKKTMNNERKRRGGKLKDHPHFLI